MKIPDEILKILYGNYFGYVCTCNSENQPHITPVFFVYDHNYSKIFFITNEKSIKVRNIKINQRVSITVDIRDPINPFNNEGVMAQGTAEVKEKGPVYFLPEETLKLYYDIYLEFKGKYQAVVENKPLSENDVIVQINIEKLVYWRGPHFKSVNAARR